MRSFIFVVPTAHRRTEETRAALRHGGFHYPLGRRPRAFVSLAGRPHDEIRVDPWGTERR